MERLTVWRKDGRASIANRDAATPLQQTMKITDVIDRLAAIEDILGDEYDLDRIRELVEADRDGRCLIVPDPEAGKELDILEPMKVGRALQSELRKLEYRKINDPMAISPLDYTIIRCLEARLNQEAADE